MLDSVTDQHWWRARNAHGQVGMIPESYVRKDGVEVREWFHNIESRPQVEDLLKEHGKDCAFLVRPSARGKVKYSISIYYMGQVSRYKCVYKHCNVMFMLVVEYVINLDISCAVLR